MNKMERRRKLKLRLEADLKDDHTIQWSIDKTDSPLVIKFQNSDKRSAIKNWVRAVSTVTEQKAVQHDKYIRINLIASDVTMYASVYANGTIMFQGRGYEKWLINNEDKIIKSLYKYKPANSSTNKENTENSDCYICRNKDTQDMIKCVLCRTWIHKDCDIDKIIEAEIEKHLYECPNCRESTSDTNPVLKKTESKRRRRKVNGNATTDDTNLESEETKGKPTTPSSSNDYKPDSQVFSNQDIDCSYQGTTLHTGSQDSTNLHPSTDVEFLSVSNNSCSYFLDLGDDSSAKEVITASKSVHHVSTPEKSIFDETTLKLNTPNNCSPMIMTKIDDTVKLYKHNDNNHNKSTILECGIEYVGSNSHIRSIEGETSDKDADDAEKDLSGTENVCSSNISKTQHSLDSDFNINSPITNSPTAQLGDNIMKQHDDDIHEKIRDLKKENEYLKTQAIQKQTKIGELEMKLYNKSVEYTKSVESGEELQLLKDKCNELQLKLEERKEPNTNIEYEKSLANERGKYEELFRTLNSENMNLASKLKEERDQKTKIESENISLNCQIMYLKLTNIGKERLNRAKNSNINHVPQVTCVENTNLEGLKDNKGNMCFMIAAMHSLSKILPLEGQNQSGSFTTLLKRTKDLMEGKGVRDKNITEDLYNVAVKTWPEYVHEDGKIKQGDVVEFLMRLLTQLDEENHDLLTNITSTLQASKVCTKLTCKVPVETNTFSDMIITTSEIPNETSLSLQQVIDGFIPMFGTRYDTECEDCGADIEETSALKHPSQTILLHVDRVPNVGQKVDIEIYTNQQVILPMYNGESSPYSVTDVIIHKGTNASNGHYITNHYNHHRCRWEQLNNEKGTVLSDDEAHILNKQGVIYVLQSLDKVNADLIKYKDSIQINNRAENQESNHKALVEGGSLIFYRKDISLDEWKEINDITKTYTTQQRQISKSGVDSGDISEKQSYPLFSHTQSVKGDKNCRYFSKGFCKFGTSCKYKHNTSEPKDYSSGNKTNICLDYLNGHCKIGNFCSFRHEEPEVDKELDKHANLRNSITSSKTPDRDPEISPPKKICPQYEFGKCNDYHTCKLKYLHPRRCRDLLDFGECKYRSSCKCHHPKLCRKSLTNLYCMDQSCPYFHIVGTHRRNRQYDENAAEIQHSVNHQNNGKADVYHDEQMYNTFTNLPSNSDHHFLVDPIREKNNAVIQLQSTVNKSLPHNHWQQSIQTPYAMYPLIQDPTQMPVQPSETIYPQTQKPDHPPQTMYTRAPDQTQMQVQQPQTVYPQNQNLTPISVDPYQMNLHLQTEQNHTSQEPNIVNPLPPNHHIPVIPYPFPDQHYSVQPNHVQSTML